MAKVFLRKYIREIENQIDHGQLDEAIAHCRHILRKYPKHLDTYRMLGKSYLEARRYNEATDIFHRLLMAVPDDFVAHVGMSIINDVQQDMDASIWHMERAFEVQPSNSAIQAELQRLYSRRDGVEPPKIRLTRGALAHMYVQGELYPQAISEITSVLGEDAGRQDMQVLLALAYFHAGQKNESAEICSQLIRRYPYCLDANRIMVELFPEGGDSEDGQVYRNRVTEMDPYASFVTASIFRSEDVPDEAVSIERLEWDGQSVEMDAEWEASLGIGLTPEGGAMDDQPAWLKAAVSDDMIAASLPDEGAGEPAKIPEFLSDAGWSASSGEGGEAASAEEPAPALAEGDLPDWVKAMAPEGADLEANAPETPAPEQAPAPDWLESMQESGTVEGTSGPASTPLAEGTEVPDWLESAVEGAGEPAAAPGETSAEGEVPDWLGAMEAGGTQAETPAQPPASGGEVPDWLDSMGAEGAQTGAPGSEEAKPSWPESQEPTDERETAPLEKPGLKPKQPEWLESLEPKDERETAPLEKPTIKQDQPEWLESLEKESPGAGATPEEPASQEGELDWLEKMKAGGDQAAPTSSQPESDAAPPEWLKDLGAGIAGPEEAAPAASLDDTEVPDWLKADSSGDESAAAQPAAPGGEPPAPAEASEGEPILDEQVMAGWLDELEQGPAEGAPPADYDKIDTGELGKSESEQDEALSWLEGLAAKHGAKSEELLTQPDERAESEPDWIQKAKTLSGEPLMASQEPESPASDTPPPAPVQEAPPEQAIPSPGQPASGDNEVETVDLGMSAKEQEEALSWLEGLAAGQGAKPEELLTKPEERRDSEPDWVKQAKTMATSQPEEQPPAPPPAGEETAEPAETAEPSELSEEDKTGIFLQGLEEAAAAEEAATDQAPAAEEAAPEVPTGLEAELAEPGVSAGREPVSETPEMAEGTPAQPQDMEPEAEPAPVEEKSIEDLPDWLAGLDEGQETEAAGTPEEPPEWLVEDQEPESAKPEPAQPSDWQPAGEAPAGQPAEAEAMEPVEQPAPEGAPAASQEPVPEPPAPAPAPAAKKPAGDEQAAGPPPKRTGELSETNDPVLITAQGELSRGNIPGAMEGYGKLIKKGNLLDEVIFDLRGALQRYPVEVTIWQALGDAYMRANRLQEALDAYTKAEELIR